MSYPCWWKGKKQQDSSNKKVVIRKGWRYILWNGTCYEERIEIHGLENMEYFSKTNYGPSKYMVTIEKIHWNLVCMIGGEFYL